jgi:hypothetical protein
VDKSAEILGKAVTTETDAGLEERAADPCIQTDTLGDSGNRPPRQPRISATMLMNEIFIGRKGIRCVLRLASQLPLQQAINLLRDRKGAVVEHRPQHPYFGILQDLLGLECCLPARGIRLQHKDNTVSRLTK